MARKKLKLKSQQMHYEDAIVNGDDSRVASCQHSRKIHALGDASVNMYRDWFLHDERAIGGIQSESAVRDANETVRISCLLRVKNYYTEESARNAGQQRQE